MAAERGFRCSVTRESSGRRGGRDDDEDSGGTERCGIAKRVGWPTGEKRATRIEARQGTARLVCRILEDGA